ncbi:MAG: tRNA (adenosine(37)-N6)-threonylcarbamoyltransferase complex ATPase subunit type 1 TsaE [Clostridiales bacterium]|nr:tRNA (adenosine(37)-N6)-threonylcarbamoyltransferase complex ATPase subunit type 1 TsaE [Clostridiales bacterium]
MEIISSSEACTQKLGRELAGQLHAGSVVALYGGLGAGKTAFVRGIAEGLLIADRVTSPTYSIVNEYNGTLPLFHFDMYRLGSVDELYDIGWDTYLDRGGVCAVEWSENIESIFDDDVIKVRITPLDQQTRKITIDK